MTEQEWMESADPESMLVFLKIKRPKPGSGKWPTLSERKERLFACACCRRIWPQFVDERSRRAIEFAERYADGKLTLEELTVAAAGAYSAATDGKAYDNDDVAAPEYAALNTIGIYDANGEITTMTPSFFALNAADNAASSIANRANPETPGEGLWYAVFAAEKQAQAQLLRDLVGNPFRPVTFGDSWVTPNILEMAKEIYDTQEFDRMPKLADALKEAGCNSTDILKHCRGPGPHVKGCWLVDAVLGRE